jgi:hypothetical protein
MQSFPDNTIIPYGAVLAAIEDRYGPLSQKVRCGLKSCRTSHKRGFIVVFRHPSDGCEQRGLLGHVCGRKAFGESWQEARGIFNIKIRTAEIETAAKVFREKALAILPELRSAIPRLQWFRQAYQILSQHAPGLMRLCVDGVRTKNGFLVREREGKMVPVLKIEGSQFFTSNHTLDKARELLLDIENLQRYMASDGASVREVERRLSMIGDLGRRWEMIARWMQAGNAALHPSNMRRVIDVVNKISRYEEVRMKGTVIEHQSRDTYGHKSYGWAMLLDVAEDIIPSS